jgi:hypothetical protein
MARVLLSVILCHSSANASAMQKRTRSSQQTPSPASPTSAASLISGRLPSVARYKRKLAYPTFLDPLLLLAILLAITCLVCFFAAHYLWNLSDSSPSRSPLIPPMSRRNNNTEKYLAYLPHSGFHNQRIAFENALILSRILNRTLVVPPIRLGYPIAYKKFRTLYKLLSLSGKDGLGHCAYVPSNTFLPVECFDYFDYTYLPWSWLINLTQLMSHQRLLFQPDMSPLWIRQELGLFDHDVLILEDLSSYQFRFLDTSTDSSPADHKFIQDIHVQHLTALPHRLIQIGTLFGTSRLRLKNKTNAAIRKEIRESMLFSNPLLLQVVNSIQTILQGNYVAVHLRGGDGGFRDNRHRTSKDIWWKIVHQVLESQDEEDIDQLRLTFLNNASNMSVEAPAPRLGAEVTCRRPLHDLLQLAAFNVPLFIATDLREAASDPLLEPLLRMFPCTFFLEDFSQALAMLDDIKNADGVHLKSFLLPFIDAMVAAKAVTVAGTEGSTYSDFIVDVLWPMYHDLPIKQRG